MDEILSQIFQVGFFAAMIRIATPLLFATIGELFAERSGVLNLGIEGIMLLSTLRRLGLKSDILVYVENPGADAGLGLRDALERYEQEHTPREVADFVFRVPEHTAK